MEQSKNVFCSSAIFNFSKPNKWPHLESSERKERASNSNKQPIYTQKNMIKYVSRSFFLLRCCTFVDVLPFSVSRSVLYCCWPQRHSGIWRNKIFDNIDQLCSHWCYCLTVSPGYRNKRFWVEIFVFIAKLFTCNLFWFLPRSGRVIFSRRVSERSFIANAVSIHKKKVLKDP